MQPIPFLDWNGDGRIDPQDIALTLAIAEDEETRDDTGEDDGDE